MASPRYDGKVDGVIFTVEVDGKAFTACVSREALEDHCDLASGDAADQVDAYNRHHQKIDAVAERKIRAGHAGVVPVHTADL